MQRNSGRFSYLTYIAYADKEKYHMSEKAIIVPQYKSKGSVPSLLVTLALAKSVFNDNLESEIKNRCCDFTTYLATMSSTYIRLPPSPPPTSIQPDLTSLHFMGNTVQELINIMSYLKVSD